MTQTTPLTSNGTSCVIFRRPERPVAHRFTCDNANRMTRDANDALPDRSTRTRLWGHTGNASFASCEALTSIFYPGRLFHPPPGNRRLRLVQLPQVIDDLDGLAERPGPNGTGRRTDHSNRPAHRDPGDPATARGQAVTDLRLALFDDPRDELAARRRIVAARLAELDRRPTEGQDEEGQNHDR
jgi:hypothetical protein